jgi:hypothetical protein
MINPGELYDLLKANGVGFFVGVPDSLLANFCAYIQDNSSGNDHIIAANEVKLTYVGSNGTESRLIKSKEIEAIQKTLELYELLGGETVN